MALLEFPRSLMRDRRWQMDLVAKSATGGRSFAGPMPTVRMDGGGVWMLNIGDVQVSTQDNVKAWRALGAMLDGGATDFIVPVREELMVPVPVIYDSNGNRIYRLLDEDGFESEMISATLASSAALRATSLTIDIDTSDVELRGGEMFSLEHPTHSHKAYRIGLVTDNEDGTWDVNFRPPLREAADAGDKVQFDYPKCVMRLADPQVMDLTLERREFGQGRMSWVEAFPPYNELE